MPSQDIERIIAEFRGWKFHGEGPVDELQSAGLGALSSPDALAARYEIETDTSAPEAANQDTVTEAGVAYDSPDGSLNVVQIREFTISRSNVRSIILSIVRVDVDGNVERAALSGNAHAFEGQEPQRNVHSGWFKPDMRTNVRKDARTPANDVRLGRFPPSTEPADFYQHGERTAQFKRMIAALGKGAVINTGVTDEYRKPANLRRLHHTLRAVTN